MNTQVSIKHVFAMVVAAIPAAFSLLLMITALNLGQFLVFGIAWPLFQLVGYTMTLKIARGDFTHPMVVTQICLHWIIAVLLITLMVRSG